MQTNPNLKKRKPVKFTKGFSAFFIIVLIVAFQFPAIRQVFVECGMTAAKVFSFSFFFYITWECLKALIKKEAPAVPPANSAEEIK